MVGAGIATALGGIITGAMANRSRRRESARNRDFQERMRNTQWQAAVTDMEKAGINPALAYSQGGAASPGGSMAAQENVGAGVSSALQNTLLKKQMKLLDSQAYSAYETGRTQALKAEAQEIQNRLYGTWNDLSKSRWEPGPLWDMTVSNARSAAEIFRQHGLENTVLQGLADAAGSDIGKRIGWLRLLMQAKRGG